MPPNQAPRRRVCDHHLQDRCSRGSQCPFLHAGPPGAAIANATGPTPTSPPSRTTPALSGAAHANATGTTSTSSTAHTWTTPAPPGACHQFFDTGRCSRKQCNFPHIAKDNGANGDTGGPSQPRQALPRATSTVPPGVCQEFFDTGKCNKAFDCRFRHIRAEPQPDGQGGLQQPVLATDNMTHVGKVMDPIEAHNALSRFQKPGYKFFTSLDIYTFVTALSSAKEENDGWELGDANLLIKTVGDPTGNLFILVDNIFRHENVSINAGRERNILSFQRGYMPLISYYASSFVVRSTLHESINALYGLMDTNFDRFAAVLESCLQASMDRRSFSEGISGLNVFRDIAISLNHYATTFKQAVASHPTFAPLVRNLSVWFSQWADTVQLGQPGFDDDEIRNLSDDQKRFMLGKTRKAIASLVELVDFAEGYTTRIKERGKSATTAVGQRAALLTALELNYEGPGQHRQEGPRHDNDSDDIVKIRIAPTHEELCSPLLPYLPANVPGGPHHLPGNSMARLVDIQFRLLREDLIAPIRSSINHVLEALQQPPGQKLPPLAKILAGDGGLHKSVQDGSVESVMFSVYTGVTLQGMACDTKNGLSIEISFNAPPGRARDPSAASRAAYWESVAKKRLMQGGLVALIWKAGPAAGDTKIYLGSITSHLKDLIQSTKKSHETVKLHLSFFDAEAYPRMLTSLQRGRPDLDGSKYLVEAPILFESIRPFLETLQKTAPSSIPLERYLAHPDNGSLKAVTIDLPSYATRPGYTMDLSGLCDQQTQLTLRPSDRGSVELTRTRLKAESHLDPSQADALLDTLVSELSLIQGPPGTGKSFTGIKILQVLVANKIGPILLIAFTNHALDNILIQVLEKKITNKVVRLGTRSNHEIVSEYSLDNLSMKHSRSQMANAAGREYRSLKIMEEEMAVLMTMVINREIPQHDLVEHIAQHHPNHHDELTHPPFWIQNLFDEIQKEGWITAGKKDVTTLPDFWLQGGDLQYITPPAEQKAPAKKAKKDNRANRFESLDEQAQSSGLTDYQMELATWAENVHSYFTGIGLPGIPPALSTSRTTESLLQDWRVWSMTLEE
ncbi:hypothetical protein FRB94_001446, partial [Tulasnella sp. JGI-2019a]